MTTDCAGCRWVQTSVYCEEHTHDTHTPARAPVHLRACLQAQRAAGVLRSLGVVDAFIWADISSRAQETAKVLAQELDIRQVFTSI